jgi:tRNA1(Val) A37 N6-methylase TrmN6
MHLYQYEDGYRYNSDSLVLYGFISQFKLKGYVLDVGSGCGILGLLLKRDFTCIHLSQIEIQKAHYLLNEKNAQENGLETEMLLGSFLEFCFDKKFDFVVSNPPFYHEGSKKSENDALKISRYANNLPLEAFCKKVSSVLKPRGSFLFCYDAKQIDLVFAALKNNKFQVETLQFVHSKADKNANLVLIHAKKSSKALVNVLPPLILHDTDGNLAREVACIYEKSQTKSMLWQN